MCGLAGIFNTDGRPVEQRALKAMTDAIAHRGPDGDGFWLSPDRGCGLGHRRLAIIDIDARADQPMLTPDGRHAMVFNGEIYNFLEVRAELEAKGHRFTTESDSEVLLASWREWGEAMLPRLNGMWAFAIYDVASRELFVARDRFGVKPLLYSWDGRRFAFGSENRALLALDGTDRTIDADIARRAVFDPFTIEGTDRTLYRGMHRLPAGHMLRVGPQGLRISRWWRTVDHLVAAPSSLAAAADEFWDRFQSAVKIRMRSDVPIGSCLSGGFDSSAIVATMRHIAEDPSLGHQRQSESWRHAFIASFPGMSNDETADGRLAASYAGIEPTVLDFSQDRPAEHLEAVLDTMEDIFIGLPTAVWKTYRAVADGGIRVSIDGHGADEMMGGYRQGGRDLQFKLRNLLGNASGRAPFVSVVNDQIKVQFLRRNAYYFLRGVAAPRRFPTVMEQDTLPADWGLVNKRFYHMFHATVLPTLLRNFDRLSMAHSVEVRSPFLDWRVATFVLSLPDDMKNSAEYSKLVAREGMRGRMPESIRSAKRKVGFGSQMPEWLNGGLGAWMLDRLATPHDGFDALVDRPRLVERVKALNATQGWDWESAGRLWPYANLKWIMERCSA